MGSKAWEVLDFVLLRLLNIAIVAPKVALKHRSKSWVADPATHRPSPPPLPTQRKRKKNKKTVLLKLIHIKGNTTALRSTHY